MSNEKLQKIRSVLADVAKDAQEDAAKFDGKPFNGRTVAEYFGNHGAAIQALANALDELYALEQARRHGVPLVASLLERRRRNP